MTELLEAIALEAQFQEEAYDRFGFPRFVDGFNLREAGRKSWYESAFGRPSKAYATALAMKIDLANQAIKDEDRPVVRPWRGESHFTIANRQRRRALRYGTRNH